MIVDLVLPTDIIPGGPQPASQAAQHRVADETRLGTARHESLPLERDLLLAHPNSLCFRIVYN
jgi:hypothetical protein